MSETQASEKMIRPDIYDPERCRDVLLVTTRASCSQETRHGDHLFACFATWRLFGFLAAALSALLTVGPEDVFGYHIPKWWTAVVLAISILFILGIRQMKLIERSSVHYYKADAMRRLYQRTYGIRVAIADDGRSSEGDIVSQHATPAVAEGKDLEKIYDAFDAIVEETGDMFAKLNVGFGTQIGKLLQGS